MDITDFLSHNRKEEYLAGHYRESEKGEPIYFEYGIENERTNAYSILFQGILNATEKLIIRTTWDIGFKINAFISTQDGKLWQINDYVTRISGRNKNASRILQANPSTEYVISLTGVQNPQGVL